MISFSIQDVSRVIICTALLATSLSIATASSAQNLISDGSFEVGAVPSCNQGSVPSTWFSISLTPDVYSTDCAALPGLALTAFGNFTTIVSAYDGLRFVAGTDAFGLNETFGQTLATPLVPGATYQLSGAFSLADSRPQPGVYDVYLSPSTSHLIPEATLIATIGDTAVIGSWAVDSEVFVAPANAATATNLLMIVRSLSASPNSYIASDLWVIKAVSAVPILGPIGWAVLLLGGCGGAVVIQLRRSHD